MLSISLGPARFVVLALGLILLAGPVRAADSGIRCDVFLGYDGVFAEGCWCPVTFEVENDGPAFNATIELTSSSFVSDQSQSIAVELPTDTIKRFALPVFVSSRYGQTWNVRILDAQGHVRSEQSGLRARRGNVANRTAILGALTRTAAGLPVLPKPTSEVNREVTPVSARLQTALFPDNPLLLGGLTGLYLNSEIASVLRPNQVNALLSWLHDGGHLIVGLEQPGDLTATPWLRAVLPFDPKDLQTIPLNGQFRDWVNAVQGRGRTSNDAVITQPRLASRPAGSDLKPLPEDPEFDRGSLLAVTGTPHGDVLLRAGDTPLMIEQQVGRGIVTALCFSPEREPFKSWKSAPEFWAAVLGAETPRANQQMHYSSYCTDGVWGALVETKQVHKLPVFWLLVILLGYLAVIGPVDQYVLKRLNRQMLTWVTFPLYVLGFSLLIYFIGYKLRAGESEWNEINVVDVLPSASNQVQLRGRTYASLYSPANQRYDLGSKLRFAAVRNEYLGPSRGRSGSDSETLLIRQQDDAFRAQALVSVWTSRLFVDDWWQPTESPWQATISRSGMTLTLTVQNHLAHPLSGLRVLYAGRLHTLGDVPANASTNFTFQSTVGSTLADCINRWAGPFQQAWKQRRQAFGSNREWLLDRVDAAIGLSLIGGSDQSNPMARQFTDPGLTDLPALADEGNAVVFAWVNDFSPVASMNQFKPLREHRDTLFRLAVPISQ